ncbi:hypothetical protein [Paraburkholderia dipogonis]|uniref:hypothetical protein n=1 Tax=Paraburkholderia dipogonis TaxID=1211383 RepID=UPI0038BDE60D
MKLSTGRQRAVAFFVAVLIIGAVAWRHTGKNDVDDFFSCNEQSINALHAEQARKGVSYDETAQAGIQAMSNDKCMDARGYEFTGGANGACMSARTHECYSRR